MADAISAFFSSFLYSAIFTIPSLLSSLLTSLGGFFHIAGSDFQESLLSPLTSPSCALLIGDIGHLTSLSSGPELTCLLSSLSVIIADSGLIPLLLMSVKSFYLSDSQKPLQHINVSSLTTGNNASPN